MKKYGVGVFPVQEAWKQKLEQDLQQEQKQQQLRNNHGTHKMQKFIEINQFKRKSNDSFSFLPSTL